MKIELIPESSYKSIIEILNKNNIFSKLTIMELRSISNLFYRKFVNRDEYVYDVDGQGGKILYVIEEGDLKVFLKDGREKIISKGEIFGEVALINEELNTGSVKAVKDCILLCIRKSDLLDEEKINPSIILKVYKELAKLVTTYLRSNKHTASETLIAKGESNFVEFKSSLRYNFHSRKFDKLVEHAVLKTIAAFLNAKGGVLFIGVNDSGEIVGTELDNFPNEDKMLLHATNLIRDYIDHFHLKYVNFSPEEYNGKVFLRIDVDPSTMPAYVRSNRDVYFYVRTGPSTSSLPVDEVYDYIRHRFYTISRH